MGFWSARRAALDSYKEQDRTLEGMPPAARALFRLAARLTQTNPSNARRYNRALDAVERAAAAANIEAERLRHLWETTAQLLPARALDALRGRARTTNPLDNLWFG